MMDENKRVYSHLFHIDKHFENKISICFVGVNSLEKNSESFAKYKHTMLKGEFYFIFL